IAKCIIEWVPYASTAYSNLETLIGTSEVNSVKIYKETAKKQVEYYGERIDEIKVQAKTLSYEGDYLYLALRGNNANSVYYGYSYSVAKR
ncbi:MAG: hypothetical protein Q4F05_18570, partial [bacterium]|nr:hypothetical protein [bacterium]